MLVVLLGIIKSLTNTPFTYKLWAYVNGLAEEARKLIAHHFAISEIYTFVKTLQSLKAPQPILVTPFPIVTFVKPLQPSKADPLIVVTLSGIVMLVKLLQFSNAEEPIAVILSGITIDVTSSLFIYKFLFFEHSIKSYKPEILNHAAMSVIYMFLILLQPLKVSLKISVILLGIVMFVKFVQSLKVYLSMLVTPFPIVTLVKPLQF